MKATVLGITASLLAVFISVAQQNQPQPQGPTLSYQTQPSEMEKAKANVVQLKLQPQITYSGPMVDIWRGENPLGRTSSTNVVRSPPHDDITVDLITRRPRGIVLFAVNF